MANNFIRFLSTADDIFLLEIDFAALKTETLFSFSFVREAALVSDGFFFIAGL